MNINVDFTWHVSSSRSVLFVRAMALKLSRLLRNINSLNPLTVRHASQFYPIDEYVFGLSDDQIQVSV